MSYNYRVFLTYDDGGGDTTVALHDFGGDNLLLDRGFSKTENLHNDLKPVQDRAKFEVILKTSLASTLLSLPSDTVVTVDIRQMVPEITQWRVYYTVLGGGATGDYGDTLGGGGATGTFNVTLGGGGATGSFSDTLGGNDGDIRAKVFDDFDASTETLKNRESAEQYFRDLFGGYFYSASPTYVETEAQWFYGYLRDIPRYNITGEDDATITFEALDNSKNLKNKLTEPYQAVNTTVSTIISDLLNAAGYSADEYDTGNITNIISYILEAPDKKTYWDIVADILFSYSHVFYFDSAGVFRVYDFSVESTPATVGIINDDNIVGTLNVERVIDDYDGVDVAYFNVSNGGNWILTQSLLPVNVNSGDKYPAITADDPEATIFDFSIDNTAPENDVSRIIDPSGDVARIINVSNVVILYSATTPSPLKLPIFIQRDLSDGPFSDPRGLLDLIKYQLNSNSSIEIQFEAQNDIENLQFTIYGDVKYTSKAGPFKTAPNARKPLEKSGRYIYSSDDAKRLANILDRRNKNSQYRYKLQSEGAANIGDYVTLQNVDLNIDTVARVLKKRIIENRRASDGNIVYGYELEGVGELGALFGQIANGTLTVVDPPARQHGAIEGASNGLSPSGNVLRTIKGYVIDADDEPSETGLYMTKNYLGFWDYDTSTWVARMQNDSGVGKFRVGDSTKYIEWDGSQLNISGAASISGTLDVGDTLTVAGDIQSDNFVTQTAGWKIGGDGHAEFNDADIRGTISAGTGEIGGWDITANTIESTDSTVFIRSDTKRFEIQDAVGTTKAALGYLQNVNGYTSTDFGLYVGPGNVLEVSSGGEFLDGDYAINQDAAFLVKSGTTEAARFGSLGNGDIGLDIGGMIFGNTIGGGGATGPFGDTIGGGGATGSFSDTLGGGLAGVGSTSGLIYSLLQDRLIISGEIAAATGSFSGSVLYSQVQNDSGTKPEDNATRNTGALADKNSVDLSTDDVQNKKTSNLSDDAGLGNTANWSQVNDDNGQLPEDGATLGADWDTDLNSIPTRFRDYSATPPSNGVYVDQNHIGFYDSGTGQWPIRIFNDSGVGELYAGTGGTSATDEYMLWNGANLIVRGTIYAESGEFGGLLSAATGTFSGDLSAAGGTFAGEVSGGSIDIGSGKFVVTTAGDFTYLADSIELGDGSNASGANSVAIGHSAAATHTAVVSIGDGAASSGGFGVAIGNNAGAGGNAVGIGQGADASGLSSVALGTGATANSTASVTVGTDSTANGTNSSAFGSVSVANSSNSTAIGYSADATNTGATVLGSSASASGARGVAIGYSADANIDDTISIGANASTTNYNIHTIIGTANKRLWYFPSGLTGDLIYDSISAIYSNGVYYFTRGYYSNKQIDTMEVLSGSVRVIKNSILIESFADGDSATFSELLIEVTNV